MSSKRNNNIGIWCLTFVICHFLSGCGYTTKGLLPNNIKGIYIATFNNNINITKEVNSDDRYELYRPNLEMIVTDAVISRIFLDGHLKLQDKENADAILEGNLIQYRRDPLRYQDETVNEYRISLVCDIKLRDPETSEILLEENHITGDTSYFTTGALQKTETQALTDASSDLARRIVNRIVDNW
jgi:hypothetical protein